jgi:hypothetical protein
MTVCALPKDFLLPYVHMTTILTIYFLPFSYSWHAGMGSCVYNGNE